MESAIQDQRVAEAVAGLHASLDVLQDDDWSPATCDEATVRLRAIESASRRLHALQVGLQDQIDRSGVHKADGHASAKVLVRHAANLSNAEAARRAQVVRMQRSLPAVAAGHADGSIGTPQVERLARVYGNRRVRDQLVAIDEAMATAAARLPYPTFDAALTDWERLADEDGAGDRAAKDHAKRDLRMPRDLHGSRHLSGSCGSLDGQVVEDAWTRQVEREFEHDWADARARLGDAATTADLARTDAQRRFDAFKALVLRGDASGAADGSGTARTCTDLVIDQVTQERQIAKLFGTDPGPDPRLATWWDDLVRGPGADGATDTGSSSGAAGSPGSTGLVGFRCGTIDGRPLDPAEVTVASLIGHVRRVVIGADAVVLDMGRRERCFTGARQLAVRLSHETCAWTGCEVPASQCQCDHLEAFNGPRRGRTDPSNGAPTCGRHNRLKERGFAIRRDQRGHWHVFRPDGTELA